MNTFLRNTISNIYNAVSAPVAATRDALAERLPSVCDTTSLLYNRMMENMGYGQQERLKDRHCRKRSRRGRATNSNKTRRATARTSSSQRTTR